MSNLILEPPVPLPLGSGETTGPVAGGSSQEPVAWRIFDGEGGYDFRDELPGEESQAWSARYGRKWEPLFAAPPSRKPQDDTDLLRQCLRLIESMSDSLDGEFGFGPSEPDPLVLTLRERLGEQE